VHLFLDICQAAGIAAACGIRPFLPVLLVGALATQDLGVDFSGTDFAFLEDAWFLLAMVVGLTVTAGLLRRWGYDRYEASIAGAAVAGLSLGLGGVQFAGNIADRHSNAGWGIAAGLALAALGLAVTRMIFSRAARRLDREAKDALPVYGEGVAIAFAGASVLAPPLAIVGIAFLLFLLATGRRREGEKYAGLRILR
jgi:hypothetical protein